MKSLIRITGLTAWLVPLSLYAAPKTEVLPGTTIGPLATGEDGMVVSSNSDAAQVGASVLSGGGNAVDAAVAMMFALNVSEPMLSGIGGGGFMVIYDAASEEVMIVDSRERAPASAYPTMFIDPNTGVPYPFAQLHTMGIAVGIPGALAGVDAALELFGTRSLKSLIAPAVELADGGVVVTQVLAEGIAANLELLAGNAAAKEVFLPGGTPLKAGDLLVQPDLADTFRLLQKHGIDAFYDGPIGEAFAAEVQAAGGGMTLADLQGYGVTLDEPVRGFYGDYELASMPPPSSGGLTVLQMLAILEGFALKANYPIESATKHHLILQAMHIAFTDRNAYLGDPEFVDIPYAGWLDPDYIDMRAALLHPDSFTCPIAAGDPFAFEDAAAPGVAPLSSAGEGTETTHFTVGDRYGNLVAYTTTIEQFFGTGRMLPGYGFFLNNQLTDFSTGPGPNMPEAGKRPLSSMSPTIVFKDDEPVMTIGSPGGVRIIAAVTQVLIHVLEYGLDLKTAVQLPRVSSTSCTGSIRWDPGIPDDVRAELVQLGHKFDAVALDVGNVNLMAIQAGTYTGVADVRRNGVAIGLTDVQGKGPGNKK
jgi:gamma-glutamyltranspeptidase/glutathione hydrolase